MFTSIGTSFWQTAALNLIWSMINAQQVTVHTPFMNNMKFPGNAQAANRYILDVASFDLIDTEEILDSVIY